MSERIDNPISLFESLRPVSKQIKELWTAEKEVVEKYYVSFQNSERIAIMVTFGAITAVG